MVNHRVAFVHWLQIAVSQHARMFMQIGAFVIGDDVFKSSLKVNNSWNLNVINWLKVLVPISFASSICYTTMQNWMQS